MDRKEQGVDQRKQRLVSGAEWEERALKLLLLNSECAIRIRDMHWHEWRMHNELLNEIVFHHWDIDLDAVGIELKPYPCNRIAKALRKLARKARDQVREAKREYRDRNRRNK